MTITEKNSAMTISWSQATLQSIEELATQKNLTREAAVIEIVEEYLQREVRRARVIQEADRKRQSPQWQEAIDEIERIRAKAIQVPEEEFQADLREALEFIRAEERKAKKQKIQP